MRIWVSSNHLASVTGWLADHNLSYLVDQSQWATDNQRDFTMIYCLDVPRMNDRHFTMVKMIWPVSRTAAHLAEGT